MGGNDFCVIGGGGATRLHFLLIVLCSAAVDCDCWSTSPLLLSTSAPSAPSSSSPFMVFSNISALCLMLTLLLTDFWFWPLAADSALVFKLDLQTDSLFFGMLEGAFGIPEDGVGDSEFCGETCDFRFFGLGRTFGAAGSGVDEAGSLSRSGLVPES